MNLLGKNLQCIECGCTALIKDHKRSEIYCSKCGLILVDNTIPKLEDNAVDEIPNKKDMQKLKHFFYGFNLAYNTHFKP